jgi:hypothetical protein
MKKDTEIQIKKLLDYENNYIWTENSDFSTILSENYAKMKFNTIEVQIIKDLVKEYYKTIQTTCRNHVPKMIMYFYIHNFYKNFYSLLLEHLKTLNIDLLFKMDDKIVAKKVNYNLSYNKLKNAIQIIQDLDK